MLNLNSNREKTIKMRNEFKNTIKHPVFRKLNLENRDMKG